MSAAGRRLLLGVSGSIAAVKAPEIVRLLVERGFDVTCLLTTEAAQFVSPLSLAAFSGKPVIADMFGPNAYSMPHLKLADSIDAMVIAPATATLIARCAHGLAEDMVSLTYITTTAPVLMAPAMHPTMWEHPATRENVKMLRARGVSFLGPFAGPLADNTQGEGRMIAPVEIVAAVETLLTEARPRTR
jgi:phosphopantothenoylcysteine decarboxylase/phosphopantothenate--cysteine ligase